MENEKRQNCPMRHDNGNCLPCGGFCTAVNDSICEALHNAFRHGESEERDRLVLSMIDANAKYQERQLEVLKSIHERVVGDTVAVVHGRWETGHKSNWQMPMCSVCGNQTTSRYKYCPNCGADMRERKTDD